MRRLISILHPREGNALFLVLFALAVGLSVFQLYQGVTGSISSTYLRPIHLSWVLVLTFMRYPLVQEPTHPSYLPARLLDLAAAAMSVWGGWTLTTFDYTSTHHLLHGLSTPTYVTGAVLILLVLEATRRTVGWMMAALGLLFLLYAMFGNLLPDAVANRGFALERVVRFQVFTASGMFGAPLGIAAGAVFMFVLFGAFLEITGAGKFFIDLAYAAAGRYRGGPAKASVLASAAMGSISGSAIANTVTTGALTIPMMKKLGFRPQQAAGVEAAASTGGQIMPPIMGAGAFIMADYTNTPYSTVVAISIIPALLYFTCTLLYVHLIACKEGLEGMKERPKVLPILKQGAHFLFPLAFITAMLLMDFSPTLSGALGCGAVVLTALLRKHTRVTLKTVLRGLEAGAMMALPISIACAVAGIVVGVIGQTGIGLQFTEFVISLSGGQLWLALILVALSALVLGMGLPVTAAYIVLAVMAAPALSGMGVPLLTSHMIIFWLSQTSNVTPPIALAAFAGAGVAGASPMKSAVEAFKLSKGFFIIPLMMAYSGLLWTEEVSLLSHISAVAATLGLILAIAMAVEGYGICPLKIWERAGLLVAVPVLLMPDFNGLGVAMVAGMLILHYIRQRQVAMPSSST